MYIYVCMYTYYIYIYAYILCSLITIILDAFRRGNS